MLANIININNNQNIKFGSFFVNSSNGINIVSIEYNNQIFFESMNILNNAAISKFNEFNIKLKFLINSHRYDILCT